MPFQQALNRDPSRAVAGDFASTNPRNAMLAGSGSLRTAEAITVGNFAFADLTTGLVYAGGAAGRRVGFVHRNNQAIVPLGQAASMVVPVGRETALFTDGDFYCVLDDDSTVGAAVTAVAATGVPSLTAAGVGHIATGFIAAEAKPAGELVKITKASI
jgi:hypothetical protein